MHEKNNPDREGMLGTKKTIPIGGFQTDPIAKLKKVGVYNKCVPFLSDIKTTTKKL